MIGSSKQRTLYRIAQRLGLPLCEEWSATDVGILVGTGAGDLKVWNPYDNPAQAFELMAQLSISVQQDYALNKLCAWKPDSLTAEITIGSTRARAIRRVIVQAAAK